MWYNKYTGFPYKHLGNDLKTGIDCFNLIRLIYKNERGIEIPYTTSDWCKIVDEDWYAKTHERYFEKGADKSFGWMRVPRPAPFDVITMYMGSTHVVNHCALYVDMAKILHTMIGKKSWIAPYGRYYEQYTHGVWRWIGLNN